MIISIYSCKMKNYDARTVAKTLNETNLVSISVSQLNKKKV